MYLAVEDCSFCPAKSVKCAVGQTWAMKFAVCRGCDRRGFHVKLSTYKK